MQDEWINEISPALEPRLSLAERVLEFGLRLPERKARSKVTVGNVRVALGIYTKSLKLYCSIIKLISIGRAESAMVLLRSEFEACLALQFVLRKRMKLHGEITNGDLRSRLYVANEMLRWEDYCRNLADTDRIKSFGKRFQQERAFDASEKHQLLHSIGAKWEERLRKRKSYSGLNIADLAKKLELYPWYSALFRLTSRSVHSIDVIEQLRSVDAEGKLTLAWRCSIDELEMAIDLATRIMIGSMQQVGMRFDYSSVFAMAIDGFLDELHRVEGNTSSK